MESNDLRALSELYLKTVYEAKAESPEEEEEKMKKDDDLAGSPNKNGKKKAKRWWDDDGDGKGYEEGEVDGKFPDKDGSKKKKVKEEYIVTRADKKGNTPAYQAYKAGKKNVKTGKPMYKAADHLKKEELEIEEGYGKKGKKKGHDCASKVKHEEYGMGDCIKEMHTLDEEGNVTHYDVMFESKIVKNIPVSDLVVIEGMYHEHFVNDEKNQEVNEGIGRTIKKAKRIAKRVRDSFDDDPGRAHTIGTLGNPNARNEDKRAAERKAGKKKVEEGYQRDPDQQKKERERSKQSDPSKAGFTGISDNIGEIMRQNAAMKKAASKKGVKEELDAGMEHNLSILRMLAEKEVNVKDTKKVVDAIRAYDKSKDASRDATDDSDKGDKEGAAIEKKYAAKERGEIKKDDPNWKNKKYHTGMHGEEVESLVASGKFSNEELMSIANLQEADIADILARLEKKRISKGGDPEESPLPAMRKYHADKKKKKVKEEFVSEKKKPSVHDDYYDPMEDPEFDPHEAEATRGQSGRGTAGKMNVRKKYAVKEGVKSIEEAERSLADRLERKRKLYDKTTKKAMQFARDEGEASGHARYRMSSISREMDKVKDKMNKEK